MSAMPAAEQPPADRDGSDESAVRRVAIIGGGRMGSGIATVALERGWRVCIVEPDTAAAERARSSISRGLTISAERNGQVAQPRFADEATIVSRIEELPSEVDLAIEAVPENPELKADVLARLSRHVGTSAVIATNTSSISVDQLASSVHAPERFLGMHFFNPVPASKLVEVIRGAATHESAVAQASGWVQDLGKTPIIVSDAPGFASSRLGVLLGFEAIRMLEEGIADAESIDAAMTLGYGHAMGPLRSTDLVGLDVRLAIGRYLHSTLGERFAPPRLLEEKVAAGDLGRKSGRGFYTW